MTLGELVASLGKDVRTESWRDRDVSRLVQDSRAAGPGALFVAVRGFHSDGHSFIPQALELGAVAVVAEEGASIAPTGGVPVVRVPDTRKALARLATTFYGRPSTKLKLVGITGTKGKTTTSYLTRSIIEAAGQRAGLIGTIDYRIGDRIYPAPNTTPESVDLQALLAKMVEQRAGYCVMEVSSHALALGRTDGCVFEAAAFTNLAPEHLDFHASLDEYFQAKLTLFAGLGPEKTAVVNQDDARCGEILRGTTARVITYGLGGGADIRPVGEIEHDRKGLRFRAATPLGEILIASTLMGMYNVQNILAAVGLGVALGCAGDAISKGIRDMAAVPGRMETVDAGQDFSVIVDYAHTEESLRSLLCAVRDVCMGRVITVFGCGGDRDRSKRPHMGAAALAGSDLVIVTSDNPRTEDPLVIIREIESGMQEAGHRITNADDRAPAGGKPYLVIPDRAAAIETAVAAAGPGDAVVLAGKGHEEYQIVGNKKFHFDDREEARRAIGKVRAA
jgi:UDP-N-acetylmuramoyl-L-alanyl-D-glutamate--2,6-diaminopimelate ligase